MRPLHGGVPLESARSMASSTTHALSDRHRRGGLGESRAFGILKSGTGAGLGVGCGMVHCTCSTAKTAKTGQWNVVKSSFFKGGAPRWENLRFPFLKF